MGRTATIIAVSYTVVSVLAILIVLAVAASTRARRREADARLLAEREKAWFVIVVVLLAALLFATIFFTPYGRGESGRSAQVVDVRSQQFAWTGLKPVRAGEEVQFRLTATDVNHAFAVYTQRGKFLFQVQVQPGKTQIYRYTFKRPGTYRILCLEYCGVGHDAMIGQLTVRA